MSSSSLSSRARLVPIVLGQAFGVACGVAGVTLNSHLIPPETLGAYGVFLTFAPIGVWVVHAGLVKFMVRHWAASRTRPRLLREVTRAWWHRLPWLALAAAAGTGAIHAMTGTGNLGLWLALLTAAALLAWGGLIQAALQAERAHWRDCSISVSASLSRTFGPPLLYLAAGGTMMALWLGFAGHALVVTTASAWAARPYWRTSAPAAARRELTRVYEGPLFITLALAGWTLAGLNRWIVAWCFGDTQAGYFTLAGGAAVVIASTAGTVFTQYFQPGFFALGDNEPAAKAMLARQVDRVALAYGVGTLGLLSVCDLIAPSLIGRLISPTYGEALVWILPAGAFTVATTTAIFYHSRLLAGRREKACGPADLTTAAVLAAGCIGAALGGPVWFARWLMISPIVPWALTRPMAHRYFFQSAADPSSGTTG